MIRNNHCLVFFRLFVNDMRDVVGRGFTCAIRPIEEHGRTGTDGCDHGRGDEEFGFGQGRVGFSRGHEEGEGRLVEVDGAEGVYLEVCLE